MTTDAKAIKEMEKINEQNDTGVPLSELQPEGVVYGEPVGSKDGDKSSGPIVQNAGVAGNTGLSGESAAPTGTTETDYPAAQKPTTKK